MKRTIDLTNVEEPGEFKPLPAGKYATEITYVEDSESSNGDPMIKIRLTVKKGDYKGRIIFDNILFMEGNPIMGRAKHFLHCIGEPYEGKVEYDTDNWRYKTVEVISFIENYKGKDYAKVAEYLLPLTAEINESDLKSNDDDVPF